MFYQMSPKLLVAGLSMFWMLTMTCHAEEMPNYLNALQGEINNRAVAAYVVPALAKRMQGSSKGSFWAAYTSLERYQQPAYQAQQQRFRMSPSGFNRWFKGNASLLAAYFHHEWFVEKLAGATSGYLQSLKAVSVPEEHKTFWDYVIAQEEVQVNAMKLASEGRYRQAASLLNNFIESGPLK